MKYIFCIACLAATILLSCSKNKSSNCGSITFKAVDPEKYDSSVNRCSVVINSDSQENEFLIIRSREELLARLSFKSYGTNPLCQQSEAQFQDIDFDKEILLIGKEVVPRIPATFTEQSVYIDCMSGRITYHVRYEFGDATYQSFGLFKFGVIIPKPAYGASISLNIAEVDPK